MTTTAVLPFQIEPLSEALGARITGIDLSRELDADTVAALRRAWLENVIVVFPGQELTEADQERFCRGFGKLELVRSGVAQDAAHPSIMLITNVRDTGKLTALEDGEMYFHYDQCYYEVPADASILYAMEVPKVGGHTVFAKAVRATDLKPTRKQMDTAANSRRRQRDFEVRSK